MRGAAGDAQPNCRTTILDFSAGYDRPCGLISTTLVALAEVGHGIAINPSNVQTMPRSVRRVLLVHRDLPIGRWSSITWNQHRFLPRYGEEFVAELVASLQRKYPGQEFT